MTDRGNTSIVNMIEVKHQELQSLVAAEIQTQHTLIMPHYQSEQNRVAPKKRLYEEKFIHKFKE
jgi:hypothetical protein